MALYDSGHSASVAPAVQRREQLLRSLLPPTSTTNTATAEQVPEAQPSVTTSEPKSDVQVPPSRSQEIAHEVLSTSPLARFSLLRRDGSSPASGGLRRNLLRSAGSGGPENPIFVTIAERTY